MKNQLLCSIFTSALLLVLSGCVDKFAPDVITAPNTFLVVDGSINPRGVTTIRLARTQNLTATDAPPVEAGATVALQDENRTRYPLTETAPGTYTSEALTLDASRRYQLQLRTTAGRDYASDLVTAKITPPIDKVSWALEELGAQIYVDTHDPANATRFYRWRFTETWEFQPAYQSTLVYDAATNTMQPRPDDIYHCWRSAGSFTINLSSTEKLSQDVVEHFPLTRVPTNSDKLRLKYSILVQQYAQTAEEYAYYENLKKNTESLGGFSDPQPTQLTGNVHCQQDGAEPVIGYVGAASVAEQRLFIATNELPPIRYLTGYEDCSQISLSLIRLAELADYFSRPSTSDAVPVEPAYEDKVLIGYNVGGADCVDCRRRGTNVKPSFWP